MCPGSPSPGALLSRTSHLPEKAEQKEEWSPRLPILKSPCLCPASSSGLSLNSRCNTELEKQEGNIF